MSTLTERVARIADPSLWKVLDHETRSGGPPQDSMAARQREMSLARAITAIREVLAAMREPSEGMAFNGYDTIGCALEAGERFDDLLDAFAREHGVDPPPAEEPQP